MSSLLPANEAVWRLGFFLATFLVMAVWELTCPRRRQDIPRLWRWSNNIGIVVLDALVVRLVFPILAVGVALLAADHSFGLFNWFEIPFAVAIIGTLLIMDFAIYLQHVLFHAVPLFWRLHRMHHADLDFDVTTGVRFHPVEILLSMAIKMVLVAIIGAPAIAVLVFEILLNITALFNHSNVRLPRGWDKVLRMALVTPDMHRVHHSILPAETNSNFGFNLPWWDWMFGTYRDQPKEGHNGMTIGIELFRTRTDLRIDQMLIQPLRDKAVE